MHYGTCFSRIYTALILRGPLQAAGEKEVLIYLRPEDQFLHKHSTMSYTFPVPDKSVGRDELQPLRIVMLVGAQEVKAARWAF